MRAICIVLFSACLLFPVKTAGQDAATRLQAKIHLAQAKPAVFGGWRVIKPGTILLVQRDGLAVGFVGDLRRTTTFKAGEIVSSTGGVKLKPGDKVYIYKVDAGPSQLVLHIVTANTYDNVNVGSVTHELGEEAFVFSYDKPLAEIGSGTVLDDVAKWFKTESEASAAKTVKLGQTPEEVETILGPPEKRVDLGAKLIYTYRDMKIIFIDKKVSDVQ